MGEVEVDATCSSQDRLIVRGHCVSTVVVVVVLRLDWTGCEAR